MSIYLPYTLGYRASYDLIDDSLEIHINNNKLTQAKQLIKDLNQQLLIKLSAV